jgi:hypothetical protein
MDAITNEVKQKLVDDIDDEVYFREMLGCTAKMSDSGDCATINCGQGDYRICQDPTSTERRMIGDPCVGCDEPC